MERVVLNVASGSLARPLVLALTLFTGFMAPRSASAQPLLVVLAPTGAIREGLPVMAPHPDPAATLAVLERGFSGRLLRLYALEQEWLRQKKGVSPEPAYLVLSDRQGGFPQTGFYLGDTRKDQAGWVDLHRTSRLSGGLGAVDQIFPHELLHIIVRQLAGEPRKSGANQIHAIGVRTDPVTAFSEGVAEAMQILAVDDADAVADTQRLPQDLSALEGAERAFGDYAEDLLSRWWPIQPSRMRFLLWFNQAEQVMRYHGVKENRFAHAPDVPAALLNRPDKYPAYLFANVVPGRKDGAIRSASVLLSSEAVVAHLFWRLLTDASLQLRRATTAFYSQFGTGASAITPLDNVFLKLFAALYEGRPSTTRELLTAYARLFPDDAADVNRVVRDALLGQELPDAPELWLANDGLLTGTSLFDQYRALPRPHTFDVNAATSLDWLSVPGIAEAQAAALLDAAPFSSLDDVLAVAPLAARPRLVEMSSAMARLRQRAVDEEETLSLSAIVWSYLRRLGALLAVTTFAGSWLARATGARRWWTAALITLTASVLVIAFAWIITSPPWYALVAAPILGGLPWAAWRLARRQPVSAAARAVLVWALAAMPAVIAAIA